MHVVPVDMTDATCTCLYAATHERGNLVLRHQLQVATYICPTRSDDIRIACRHESPRAPDVCGVMCIQPLRSVAALRHCSFDTASTALREKSDCVTLVLFRVRKMSPLAPYCGHFIAILAYVLRHVSCMNSMYTLGP